MTFADRYAAILRVRATARVWALAGERLRDPTASEQTLAERAARRPAHTEG